MITYTAAASPTVLWSESLETIYTIEKNAAEGLL